MILGCMNDPKKDTKNEIFWIKKNFDFIDLTIEYPMNANKKQLKRILKGFPVIGHTDWSLPVASPYEKIRKAAVEEIKENIDIFHSLKCKYVNVHANIAPKTAQNTVELHAKSLNELMHYCSPLNMEIMLENMPDFSFKELSQLSVALPSLKFHLDIAHAFIAGDIEKIIRKFHKKIVHIHVSDNRGLVDEHFPIGIGKIDWIKVVKLLKKYKYDGTITIEVHTDRSHALFSRAIFNKIWESLE